jgi:hypothetical protein
MEQTMQQRRRRRRAFTDSFKAGVVCAALSEGGPAGRRGRA